MKGREYDSYLDMMLGMMNDYIWDKKVEKINESVREWNDMVERWEADRR